MRDRKIIMDNLAEWKAKNSPEGLTLEVLLDIRDLLIQSSKDQKEPQS